MGWHYQRGLLCKNGFDSIYFVIKSKWRGKLTSWPTSRSKWWLWRTSLRPSRKINIHNAASPIIAPNIISPSHIRHDFSQLVSTDLISIEARRSIPPRTLLSRIWQKSSRTSQLLLRLLNFVYIEGLNIRKLDRILAVKNQITRRLGLALPIRSQERGIGKRKEDSKWDWSQIGRRMTVRRVVVILIYIFEKIYYFNLILFSLRTMGIDLIRGGRIANRGIRKTKSSNSYLKSLIKVYLP